MSRSLPPALARAVNDLDTPLVDLLEACLVQAETIQAGTLSRESFWTRLFDGVARGNPLARHLAEREAAWFAQHKGEVGTLHALVSRLAIHLRAGGQL